jgi:hypothetical protein
MTISAKIIAHSRAGWADNKGDFDGFYDQGKEITTFQLRYPRFIHAEVMTHRVFSRNASSSRAIPVETMIANIKADTAMPVHWGKNQPGMQADEECHEIVHLPSRYRMDGLDKPLKCEREWAWNHARDRAIETAQAFHDAHYHKQVVNRILEPFMHIDVIVTATNFDNFYWLRRHADAQPEIKVLADVMWQVAQASTPRILDGSDEWHLPYVTDEERKHIPLEELLKLSTARCARVSYLTHDGETPSFAADIKLYERLVGSVPLHASPTEHQAMADEAVWSGHVPGWSNAALSGNLDHGWVQHRKLLPGEFHSAYEAA